MTKGLTQIRMYDRRLLLLK